MNIEINYDNIDNDKLVYILKNKKFNLYNEEGYKYRISFSNNKPLLGKKHKLLVDNEIIYVYQPKHSSFIKRGYLQYFFYHIKDKDELDWTINFYLNCNDILENKSLYTTTNIERRTLKIKKLIERINQNK